MKHCTPDELIAYVDGVCTNSEAARVKAHVGECPDCGRTVFQQESVKRLLAASAMGVMAPAGLAARVASTLDTVPPPAPSVARRMSAWKGPLSISIVAIVVSSGLWFARTRPQPVDVAALVSVHRHAFQPPAGKTFLTGSDPAARAWLQQTLSARSAAPRLPLPLAGIGACHVGDTPAAIWMYRAAQPVTLIEVLARQRPPGWPPASTDGKVVSGTYGGYNVVIWTRQDRTFALVAQLPPDRLAGLLGGSP
ncbi:MAG TPA: zf-HC2 domain-containing protein [Armatimonadota bacterium]|jgi:anti-sigma factor RsiW